MNFSHLSDDKINEVTSNNFTIAEGLCDYKVILSENYTSKSGNECIRLTIDLKDQNGKKARLFHYLLVTEPSYSLLKFLKLHGFEKELANKECQPSQFVALTGKCMNKHRTNLRGEKENNIHYFISPEEFEARWSYSSTLLPPNTAAPKKESVMDNEIPF